MDLTTLLHDAVADVEPTDRLGAIRRRTRRPVRPRWYAAGGVVLATAAVVAAVAVLGHERAPRSVGPAPAVDPTSTSDPTGPAATTESPVPIYYVGATPQGPRLFRYFEEVRGGEPNHGTGTVVGLLMATPSDPDYRTLWPLDSLASLELGPDVATVTIRDASVHDRPPGMTADEAALAVQQVVYTVQAAAQARVPVQFELDGNPVDQVFGVPTSEPLAAAPQLDVLALVSISNPAEGRVVEDHFSADGAASSFEGTVPWELRDARGAVVRRGSAQGTMEDHLTPWQTDTIDVSDLPAGTYTFVAMTDDPSGGEGGGPTTDTRTISVR